MSSEGCKNCNKSDQLEIAISVTTRRHHMHFTMVIYTQLLEIQLKNKILKDLASYFWRVFFSVSFAPNMRKVWQPGGWHAFSHGKMHIFQFESVSEAKKCFLLVVTLCVFRSRERRFVQKLPQWRRRPVQERPRGAPGRPSGLIWDRFCVIFGAKSACSDRCTKIYAYIYTRIHAYIHI